MEKGCHVYFSSIHISGEHAKLRRHLVLELNVTLHKHFIHCIRYDMDFISLLSEIWYEKLCTGNQIIIVNHTTYRSSSTLQFDKVSRLVSGKVDYLCVLCSKCSHRSSQIIYSFEQLIKWFWSEKQNPNMYVVYDSYYMLFMVWEHIDLKLKPNCGQWVHYLK